MLSQSSKSVFNCLNCGKERKYYPTRSQGKYCNHSCQTEYKWQTIHRFVVEAGHSVCKRHMKRYLREERGDKCELCPQGPEHNGKPLVLQLDHIDGDSDNNLPVNLRLLCPNCHSQTDTYCGKNKVHGKETKRNKYLRAYQSGTPS